MINFDDTVLVRHLRERGLALSNDDIALFEMRCRVRLPDDYKSFLVRYNGGRCSYRDYVGFPMWDTPYCGVIAGLRFFGLNYGPARSTESLDNMQEEHVGRLPDGAIPIADSVGEDLLIIDRKRDCSIALWQRHMELDLSPDANRLFVAETFTDFICGFVREPIEELRELADHRTEPFLSVESHDEDGLRGWLDNNPLMSSDERFQEELVRFACKQQDLAGIALLLAKGFPPDSTRSGGPAPIEIAEHHHEADIVILLLEYGASEDLLYRSKSEPIGLVQDFIGEWKAGRRSVRDRFKF